MAQFLAGASISSSLRPENQDERREKKRQEWRRQSVLFLAVLLIYGLILLLGKWIQAPSPTNLETLKHCLPWYVEEWIPWYLAAISAYLAGLAFLLVAAQQLQAHSAWKKLLNKQDDLSKHRQLARTVQSSYRWNGFFFFLLTSAAVVVMVLFFRSMPYPSPILRLLKHIALGTAIPTLSITTWLILRHRRTMARNLDKKEKDGLNYALVYQSSDLYTAALGSLRHPTILLGLKATLLICIGLQITYPGWPLIASIGARIPLVSEIFYHPLTMFPSSWFPGSLVSELLSTQGSPVALPERTDAFHTVVDIFTGFTGEQAGWILCMLALILFLHFLEHEWVIRQNQMARQEPSLQHALNSKPTEQRAILEKRNRPFYVRLAEQSFFHSVYQSWLPILIVPVNLGFDTLDHRRVVEAMLAGLRDAYRDTFFKWSNPFTVAIRAACLVALVAAIGLASFHWFMLGTSRQLHQVDRGRFCYEHVPASRTYFVVPTPNAVPPEVRTGSTDTSGKPTFWQSEAPSEEALERTTAVPVGMRLACQLGGESLAGFLQWPLLPSKNELEPLVDVFDPPGHLASPERPRSKLDILPLLFRELSPLNRGSLPTTRQTDAGSAPTQSNSPHWQLRIYHLLLLSLFLASGRFFFKRYPILPYTRTLRDLELLIESLSSRLREESRSGASPIGRLVGVLVGEERVTHREADPFDPRSVELRTLAILRNIQQPVVQIPFLTQHRVNLPVPEVIFKFDELDKLGIGVIPPHDTTGPESPSADILNKERMRSQALRQLFAELKNVISSGAARFIFVGGRNLHDEWLADQTARRPLLTNIFEDELYLPSMIIDGEPWESTRPMWCGVRNFLQLQYLRAKRLNRTSLLQRYRPWLTPWPKKLVDPTYDPLDEEPSTKSPQSHRSSASEDVPTATFGGGLRLCGYHIHENPDWWEAFQVDFIQFLTYRSQGNLKRIRNLLEGFIQPTRTAMARDAGQQLIYDCQHVLYFRDTDRFRVQLVADIFRQIAGSFSPRMVYRDDKMVVGILYLSDFILKFHRRAFAWSSLQKVDELAHIHRAPDLPKAVAELVQKLTEPYLHSIRNGMYDFRFNSDFAREIEYLSKRSEEELAAFNFTLDESQALKAIYRSRIEAVKEPESYEFISALGELHDFDEEYEVARYYYVQAIDLLDRHFHSQVSPEKATPTVYQVLSRPGTGQEAARRRLTWGVSRLRLKLQIGMSYERARDLEQAQAVYRNARTLAAALLEALLNPDHPENGLAIFKPAPDEDGPDYVSTLKHLKILFQPAFAEAWVSEKVVSGVDTSLRLLERRIWELRWMLPVVRGEYRKPGRNDERNDHANFALIMAEQHNKAGDLLFFKGKQIVNPRPPETNRRSRDGTQAFLNRSHYHYVISLYEIRSFNVRRREAMRDYLLEHDGLRKSAARKPESPLRADGSWGDFVYRTTAGTLADLGETFLAQVSLRQLRTSFLTDSSRPPVGTLGDRLGKLSDSLDQAFSCIRKWLAGEDDWISRERRYGETLANTVLKRACLRRRTVEEATVMDWGTLLKSVFPSLSQQFSGSKVLKNPFGKQNYFNSAASEMSRGKVQSLVTLETGTSNLQYLLDYFFLSLCVGDFLARSGYRQDAARKHLRILETITLLVGWFRARHSMPSLAQARDGRPTDPGVSGSTGKNLDIEALMDLMTLAVHALERADRLFREPRRPKERLRSGVDRIEAQPRAVTLVGGLLLATAGLWEAFHDETPLDSRLSDCIDRIATILFDWSSGSKTQFEVCRPGAVRKMAREQLRSNLEMHSYPLAHRLLGLKFLIDDATTYFLRHPEKDSWSKEEKTLLEQSLCHIKELQILVDVYDSPLHFPPLMVGVSQALFSLVLDASAPSIADRTLPDASELAQWARTNLEISREMVSMGRSYYDVIAELHYLYDDFNDRLVHYNHAIQMLGSEVSQDLDRLLEPLLGFTNE